MQFKYTIMQFKYVIMQFKYVIMQLCYLAHFGSPGCPTLLTELKQKGRRPGFYFLNLITLMSAFSFWTQFRDLFTIESLAFCSDNMSQTFIIQNVKEVYRIERIDREESTFSYFHFGHSPNLRYILLPCPLPFKLPPVIVYTGAAIEFCEPEIVVLRVAYSILPPAE